MLGWQRKWPRANIGIATGAEHGIFMVGPDGRRGIEALAELEQKHGPLPLTPRAKSGNADPGKHYYFSYLPGIVISNARNHRGLPIDVRGDGGLAVAPPSLHKSGNYYEWEVPPWEVPFAEPPAWLVEWCQKDRAQGQEETRPPGSNGRRYGNAGVDVIGRAIAYLAKYDPAISGQGGHSQTFAVARAIVHGFALGQEVGFELLRDHYNDRCQPKWSEKELRHKCKEADTKPCSKPRGWLLNSNGNGRAAAHATGTAGAADKPVATGADSPAPPPDAPPWPAPPAEEAFYGLAGRIVRTIEPASEADPAALLVQALVAFGNVIGRGAYFTAEADRHHGNEFAVLVGRTSKARKGTSWGRIGRLFREAEEQWAVERIQSGASSGEGIIWAVRDPIRKQERVKEGGQVSYEEVEADPGIEDKRLLVYEPEYANVLKQTERQGNTLSAILRQAWDGIDLRTLVKNSPAKATGAHISLIGHITAEELRRYLTETETANGFGNRHLWVCADRSKLLPEGGRVDPAAWAGLRTELAAALAFGRTDGEMVRDEGARAIWLEVYGPLSEGKSGLAGALLARAEAHVMRLALLYALLDQSAVIRAEHLAAALALWDYCEASVRFTFGDSLGDPVADELLLLLRNCPAGLTRTDIRDYFQRNVAADRIGKALGLLLQNGLARREDEKTGGRPAERWFAGRGRER